MRIPFFFAVLLVSATAGFAAPQTWSPPGLPPKPCISRVEIVLVDASVSTGQPGVSSRIQQDASFAIGGFPSKCTLAVLLSVGESTEVIDGRFLTADKDRSILLAELKGIAHTGGYTDISATAQAIEKILPQLRAAYGDLPLALRLSIFSDSPSFAELLTTELRVRHIDAVLSNKDSLPQIQFHRQETKSPVGVTNAYLKGPAFYVLLGLAGISLVGLLWVAVVLYSKSKAKPESVPPLQAILVTEGIEGANGDYLELVAQDHRLDVALGVSAVFSTDVDHATYVAKSREGAAKGELFRIKPLSGGRVEIQSRQRRFTVNKEPLELQGSVVSLHEPIEIRFGHRSFNLRGVFAINRKSGTTENLFHAKPAQR